MKTFDPMNSGDDSDFEQQLLGMELRRPPAEWKALLLPKPVPRWFPKPLVIGLAACWTVTAGLVVTKPQDELRDQPLLMPPGQLPLGPPGHDSFLLGSNETNPRYR